MSPETTRSPVVGYIAKPQSPYGLSYYLGEPVTEPVVKPPTLFTAKNVIFGALALLVVIVAATGTNPKKRGIRKNRAGKGKKKRRVRANPQLLIINPRPKKQKGKKGKPSKAKFFHMRLLDPSWFLQKSFRTIKMGTGGKYKGIVGRQLPASSSQSRLS